MSETEALVSEGRLARFLRDLRFLAPHVWGFAVSMAIFSLLFLLLMAWLAEAPNWVLWVGPCAWLIVGSYGWPLLALMWPLVRTGRRLWEFASGFLISLPVGIVAVLLIPDVSLVSVEGALVGLVSPALMAVSVMGVFDPPKDERP